MKTNNNTNEKKPPVRTTIRNIIDELRYDNDRMVTELIDIIDTNFSTNNLGMAADYSAELLKYINSKCQYGDYFRNLKRNVYTLHKLLSSIFVNAMEHFIAKELEDDYLNNMQEVEEIGYNQ